MTTDKTEGTRIKIRRIQSLSVRATDPDLRRRHGTAPKIPQQQPHEP